METGHCEDEPIIRLSLTYCTDIGSKGSPLHQIRQNKEPAYSEIAKLAYRDIQKGKTLLARGQSGNDVTNIAKMAKFNHCDRIWPWRYWPRTMKFWHNVYPFGAHLSWKFHNFTSHRFWDPRVFHFTPPIFQGVPFYPAFKIIFLKIQKCRYKAEFARASTLIDLTSIDMLKPHLPCLPKFAGLTFRKSLLTTEQNSNKK